MTKCSEVIQKLDDLVKSVWMEQPADVQRTRKRVGPRHSNLTIMTNAEGDLRATIDFIYISRITAKEAGVDFHTQALTMANLLEFYASRWTRYYYMEDMPKIMTEIAEALREAKSSEEFISLIEAYAVYVGKVNYWYDLNIPWAELCIEFARVKGDQL